MSHGAEVHASASLVCLAVLCVHLAAVRSFAVSRPIVLVTLVDLINLDLAHAYFALASVLAAANLSLSLDVSLPRPAAAFAVALVVFLYSCLFLYLAVGVLIQYALLRLWQVDLFDGVGEDSIRMSICIGSSAASAALAVYVLPIAVHTKFFRDLVGESGRAAAPAEPAGGDGERLAVMAGLALMSIGINLILRALLVVERRRGRTVDGDGGPPYLMYLAASAAVFSPLALPLMLEEEGDDSGWKAVRRTSTLAYLCAALPTAANACNGSFRSFVGRRILEWASEVAPAARRGLFR